MEDSCPDQSLQASTLIGLNQEISPDNHNDPFAAFPDMKKLYYVMCSVVSLKFFIQRFSIYLRIHRKFDAD